MEQIENWGLSDEFKKWVEEACIFTSTLVDRIVTGYPMATEKEEWEKLGYEDHIMVTGEPFALWVIESEKDISGEFDLPGAGLPVIFTKDHHPYKQRKVRILNGAHTSFVLASWLCGNDIVRQSMEDADIRNFMNKTIFDEVIPTLTLPEEELKQFAAEVVNRFNKGWCEGRCAGCTDHRRHAFATFRTQRHISCHSTPAKCRRLRSALLVVRCILHN